MPILYFSVCGLTLVKKDGSTYKAYSTYFHKLMFPEGVHGNPERMAKAKHAMTRAAALRYPANQRKFFLEVADLYYINEREMWLLNRITYQMQEISIEYDGEVPDWKIAEIRDEFWQQWHKIRLEVKRDE